MRGLRSPLVGAALAGLLLGSSIGAAATEIPPTGPGFGDYKLVPLLRDGQPYAGPPTPTSLDGVALTELVDNELDVVARKTLVEQGFVVMPARYRLLHDTYAEQFWNGTPVLVTTDVAYHYWHLVFDKILRDLEQDRLLPALENLVRGMRRNATKQTDELAGTAVAEDAERVSDLMATTACVLGLRCELSDRVRAELALIEAHAEWTASPILGTRTDYSLFTPRGHYTRNEDLERYFEAMSVLGQHAFELPGAREAGGLETARNEALRRAILASRTLVGDPELEGLWRTVFEPTAFLVGASDDYTPFELAAAVESTAPGGWTDPLVASDDDSIAAIAAALKAERPVLVDPERPTVRLMGTRFVLDSWILDQLVAPNVGSPEAPRVLGSALDLAAAFGSDFALAIQDEAGETAFDRYSEQMEAMRVAVAARPDEAWGRTVYDAWLAAIEPMWLPHGETFPDFMRSGAWGAKAQQTGFGSYAELKHDTILYTKQPTGETGGGGPPPALRHWVEPDPVAFARLSAVARLTRDGLRDRELLSKDQRRLLTDYIKMAERFQTLATDELAGQPISTEDNDWLAGIGFDMEHLWQDTGDSASSFYSEGEKESAIIADIMRGIDPAANTDEVLEIGTGYFDRIYVLVPNDRGDFQVARGGVYSYYEFPWPTPERLTDQQWRQMLRDDAAPNRPTWQDPLFPPLVTGPEGSPKLGSPPTRREIEWDLGNSIEGAAWEPYRRSPARAAFDPFKAGALTGVIFDEMERDLHKSVDYVVLFRFPDARKLDRYWARRIEGAESLAAEREGPCFDGSAGRGSWPNGDYLCYVSDSGAALLRWTDERTNTYGVMNAVPGMKRLATLARQWQAIRSP